MKKSLLMLMVLVATTNAIAQKGSTKLVLAGEVGIPTGDFGGSEDDFGFKTGFGGSAKILFGVGAKSQISFTSGFTSFSSKASLADEKMKIRVVPFLLGYRQNFSGFYLEPQAGMGVYSAKFRKESESETEFTWAAGIGYAKNGIDVGIRYQSGEVEDASISFVGIHVGYSFSLSRK